MVGGKDAVFFKEGHSLDYATDLTDRIWAKAGQLGLSAFIDAPGLYINDDHWILNQAGIPSVDIIDNDDQGIAYPQWHTHADTPDACSAETLEQVGTLLLHLIYE